MTIEAPVSLHEPQRQSLWAVLFLALRTVRQVGLVQLALLVGFVLARLPSVAVFMLLAIGLGLVLLAIATLQWWRYTFQIVSDELVVRRGVLSQQSLSVPLDRVQSVSLEQKLLHRVVSLVQITLDTAGSATAEFVIDAVDRPVAVALQREVASVRSGVRPPDHVEDPAAVMPPPPEMILVRHDWARVVKIAFTQLPFAGLVVIGPLLAVGDDLREFVPFDLPEIADPSAGPWLYWFVPVVLLSIVLVSMMLNLLRVLLAEWNLTVRSTATGLRRDAGLLSTTSVAATIPRIQLVQIRQNVLARIASLHTVTLQTIGLSKLAIPGCDVHQVADVRSLALGDSHGVQTLHETVVEADIFRVTRNTAVVALAAAVAGWFLVGWWSAVLLLVVPPVWLLKRRSVRLRRWGLTHDAIVDRRELFGWRRDELLLRKVNAVTVRQTLFERSRGLATVHLQTAGGTVTIGMLALGDAESLRDHAIHHVETDRGAWM